MDIKRLFRVFEETAYVRMSGTPEELRAAEYLKAACEEAGVPARIEGFPVPMGEIEEARVTVDGREIPCVGFRCCGSGTVAGELYYMPGTDKLSIEGAKGKIVLMDTSGVGFFTYKDLMEAGAAGILFRYGNAHYPNDDIDSRDLRAHVVGEERRVLCAMIHTRDAQKLVKSGAKQAAITIRQREFEGESHNVIAEIPGRRKEYITLSAHYDSTSLSQGAYDNMSGCVGLLGVMQELRGKELNYGLRFVFCGSEERGLLGSKAYCRDHENELAETALNINLDMIGTALGKFIACVSAEEKLAGYISYMGFEKGFPVSARIGVYSSDSTPFADKGVPALSFARLAGGDAAPIHCRYDTMETLSEAQLERDIAFIAEFTRRMADSALCPVSRDMPEKVKKELDEYLARTRKEQ